MASLLQSNPPIPGDIGSRSPSAQKVALEGRWEGFLGKGTLILELRMSGAALINLKRRVRTVYHPCTWHLADQMIRLVCTHDQSVTFPILSLSENVLIVRMGLESAEICELHRTDSI